MEIKWRKCFFSLFVSICFRKRLNVLAFDECMQGWTIRCVGTQKTVGKAQNKRKNEWANRLRKSWTTVGKKGPNFGKSLPTCSAGSRKQATFVKVRRCGANLFIYVHCRHSLFLFYPPSAKRKQETNLIHFFAKWKCALFVSVFSVWQGKTGESRLNWNVFFEWHKALGKQIEVTMKWRQKM